MSISLEGPYKAREIRFLEYWSPGAWKIKCYGIAHPERAMPDELVMDAAKKVLLPGFPYSADQEHHGVGFLVVHVAREAVFALLDLWTGENMLRQQLFASELDSPTEFKNLASTGVMACVWEMRVQHHERQAWIDTVLDNAYGPDLSAYLNNQLNETV